MGTGTCFLGVGECGACVGKQVPVPIFPGARCVVSDAGLEEVACIGGGVQGAAEGAAAAGAAALHAGGSGACGRGDGGAVTAARE
jgi:hypothetical protein